MKPWFTLLVMCSVGFAGCGGLDEKSTDSKTSSTAKNSASAKPETASNATFTYTCKATQRTTQLPYITGKCEAVSKRYAIAQGCHEYGTLDKDACELEACGGQPKGSLGCGMYKEMDALPKGIEIKQAGNSNTSPQPAPKPQQPATPLQKGCYAGMDTTGCKTISK